MRLFRNFHYKSKDRVQNANALFAVVTQTRERKEIFLSFAYKLQPYSGAWENF